MAAWNQFGTVEFDVGDDGLGVITFYEMANGGLTPRLEYEVSADRERLEDLERGVRWALGQIQEGG
jgi:hypothetical protein